MRSIQLCGVAFLVLSLSANQAQAQFLVKRVNCADAVFSNTEPPDVVYHASSSDIDRQLTVQITRDGCRPRREGGRFELIVEGAGGPPGRSMYMLRRGRHVASATNDVDPGGLGYVIFTNLTVGRTGGTFDYMFSYD